MFFDFDKDPNSTANTAATNAEALAGTETAKYVPPSALRYAIDANTNPRASMQGLIFDGTSQRAEATLASSLGTRDFYIAGYIDVPASAPSANKSILHIATARGEGTAAEFYLGFASGTTSLVALVRGAGPGDVRLSYRSGVITAYGGKRVFVSVSRTGTTLVVKINNVVWAETSETTSGTAPTWATDFTGTLLTFGRQGNNYTFEGNLGPFYIYNRIPSDAEQTRLFETGTPAAADYNKASNTAINTSTAVDGVAGNNLCASTAGGSFSGASASGFTAVSGGGAYAAASLQPNFTVKAGDVIRVTYTATVNSGTVNASLINAAVTGISNTHVVTTGTRTVELIATAASTSARVIFGASGSGAFDVAVSAVSIVRAGVMIAPEANAPGNGCVWNDASGNGSAINLPVSSGALNGVRWALPDSRPNKVRAKTSTNGNEQLLGASAVLFDSVGGNPTTRVREIWARARTGTPSVTLGYTSGGNQYGTSTALTTAWKRVTDGAEIGNAVATSSLWAGSNSTDVVEWCIITEPLHF